MDSGYGLFQSFYLAWFYPKAIIKFQVGWACPQCTNVFQQELLLKNHQRLICQNCDSIFKLIQSHYECRACNTKLGTQVSFQVFLTKMLRISSKKLKIYQIFDEKFFYANSKLRSVVIVFVNFLPRISNVAK